MSYPEEYKIIGKRLIQAFGGGKPKVIRYWDENEENSVDLLSLPSQKHNGTLFYGTMGLFYKQFVIDGVPFESRVEMVGAAYEAFEQFPNVLSTASFCSIKDDFFCEPGSVLPNAVSMYYPKLEAKHLYFTSPFLWEDDLDTLQLSDDIDVNWILAIPITDSESSYLKENGEDAFEDLLEENDIDIFDLSRDSII